MPRTIRKLDKPDICRSLEPEIHGGILIAWYCESCGVAEREWVCPHIGDGTIWCPLMAHGMTGQTVEDDTTIWEMDEIYNSSEESKSAQKENNVQ